MEIQQGAEPDPTLPRIDRIILYIDDLDRCKPATVKAVMEAVHLLLCSDLFVVVVGADEKWVSKSLSVEYQSLLQETAASVDQATSMDFIEKIFQVPFWLSPMTRRDMERFLDGLLEGQSIPANEEEERLSEDEIGDIMYSSAERSKDAYERNPLEREVPVPNAPAVLPPPVPVEQRVDALESVRFTAGEFSFMKSLGPLIGRTPRSAKRFVNLYRLIRARLQGSELRAFLGLDTDDPKSPPAYPLVQFLLALETSNPAISDQFEVIFWGEGFDLGDASKLLESIEMEPRLKEDVFQAFDALSMRSNRRVVMNAETWARHVARFSFRRSHWVQ